MATPSTAAIAREFASMRRETRRTVVTEYLEALGYRVRETDTGLVAIAGAVELQVRIEGQFARASPEADLLFTAGRSYLPQRRLENRRPRCIDPHEFATRLKFQLPAPERRRILTTYFTLEDRVGNRLRLVGVLAMIAVIGIVAAGLLIVGPATVTDSQPDPTQSDPTTDSIESDRDPSPEQPAAARNRSDYASLPPGTGPAGVESVETVLAAHGATLGDQSRRVNVSYSGPANMSLFDNAEEYQMRLQMASRTEYRINTSGMYFDVDRNETITIRSQEFQSESTRWYREVRRNESATIGTSVRSVSGAPKWELDPGSHLFYLAIADATTEIASITRWNGTIRVADIDGRLRGLYSPAEEPELAAISSPNETRFRITAWGDALQCCPGVEMYYAEAYLTADGRLLALSVTESGTDNRRPVQYSVEYRSVGSVESVDRPDWVEFETNTTDTEATDRNGATAMMG